MISLLSDLRVVEVSAFVAAPLGGMTLAQLGADVIRIDPIGGNIDYRRWPLTKSGDSLYWAGLNRGKRSVQIAINTPEGQELAAALIASPGEGGGILMTNLPAKGWMDYASLKRRREDLIMLQLTGNADGSAAVDYTINCASGFPAVTGEDEAPVNHVMPVWDLAAGLTIATGLLAAERHRARTGEGQEIRLSLADVMLWAVSTLGYTAEVEVNGTCRQPLGNDLYGAYGRDFATADGRRIMVVAITNRQWRAIGAATGLSERLAMIGPMMDVDLSDEGGRFVARDAISAVLAPWIAARSLAEVRMAFDGAGVLWGPYQDFRQLVREDERFSTANPMFRNVEHHGVGRFLTAASPLDFGALPRNEPPGAPRLGSATDEVLFGILGLGGEEIDRLRDRGIVAG